MILSQAGRSAAGLTRPDRAGAQRDSGHAADGLRSYGGPALAPIVRQASSPVMGTSAYNDVLRSLQPRDLIQVGYGAVAPDVHRGPQGPGVLLLVLIEKCHHQLDAVLYQCRCPARRDQTLAQAARFGPADGWLWRGAPLGAGCLCLAAELWRSRSGPVRSARTAPVHVAVTAPVAAGDGRLAGSRRSLPVAVMRGTPPSAPALPTRPPRSWRGRARSPRGLATLRG
jgi:hypothetical protein